MSSALPASAAAKSEVSHAPPKTPEAPAFAKRFDALVAESPDLDYEGLLAKLSIAPAPAAELSFTPATTPRSSERSGW